MSLSQEQDKALLEASRWYKSKNKPRPFFYLAGFAGTGKTYTAKYFAEQIDGQVLYAAFTGKAALAMRKAGAYGATTIHSLIYKPIVDDKGNVTFVLNPQSPLADAALLVIDECSMVDEKIAKHILSFNVPVLVLGDPAQLPPVEGAGYFTKSKPDAMLKDIHRQAKDNPIIHLATMIREGNMPLTQSYGESRIVDKLSLNDLTSHDQVIVGRNMTRTKLNEKIRSLHGFSGDEPMPKEKLICLKNDKDKGIFNGGMFTVEKLITHYKYKSHLVNMIVKSEDFPLTTTVRVHRAFFDPSVPMPGWKALSKSQEFDYGYAITCHKSQGSQWESTLIYDESWCFRDEKWRWLYTAFTRASGRVTLYIS